MKHISVLVVLFVIVITLVGGTQVISAQILLQGDFFAKRMANLVFPE